MLQLRCRTFAFGLQFRIGGWNHATCDWHNTRGAGHFGGVGTKGYKGKNCVGTHWNADSWFALCGVTKLEYTGNFSVLEASNRKEPWKEKRIPIQIGPLRYGLPMTRRGVVQLLPQNPGCREPLELVGESVRKPSNRDYFKARARLLGSLSPDLELPIPVSQADQSVMECFEQRQQRLLLPVQATPDKPIQTEDRSSSSHDQGVPWREVALVI